MKQTADASTCSKETTYAGKCPIVYALELIGGKWKLAIMWRLFMDEALHYNEMKRKVAGITNTMLTKSLRELEESGLVVRHSHNSIPPSVEYTLSERGKALFPALQELYRWGEKQMAVNK